MTTINQNTTLYAGFWRRAVAYSLDTLVLGAAISLISAVVLYPITSQASQIAEEVARFNVHYQDFQTVMWDLLRNVLSHFVSQHVIENYLHLYVISETLFVLIYWLYFGLQQISKDQATLGMRALSIKITNLDYKRITFAQATLRFFILHIWLFIFDALIGVMMYIYFNPTVSTEGPIIPAICSVLALLTFIIIGNCFLIGLTRKKQGFHDIIASTYMLHVKS